MEQNILNTLNKFKQELEQQGYNVYAVMLKGSQNYNLHDEESDVDANAIIIPKISDLVRNKKSTVKIALPEGECVAHDIFSFCEIAQKGNPQWVECAHTEYRIGKPIDFLKHLVINPSALKGMAFEKEKAFKKLFPSRAHMVEKHGYDPKQLHHIIRLYDLLETGQNILRYDEVSRTIMLDIKRGKTPLEEAEKMLEDYMEKLVALAEERKLTYKPQEVDWDEVERIYVAEIMGDALEDGTPKTYSYTALFEYANDGVTVSFPACAGCLTQGDNTKEALDNAREALTLWLEGMIAEGQPLPEDYVGVLGLHGTRYKITVELKGE